MKYKVNLKYCYAMAAIMLMGMFFSPAHAATATYTYDNLNRLTQVSYDNGNSIEYTYDAAGNITRVDKVGELATVDAPTVMTQAADNIASGAATLHGSVNANNAETVVSFQYGTTTAYGARVDAEPGVLDGSSDTSVSASLSDMASATTYHFRVVATNSEGTNYGADQTLTTLPINNDIDMDQDDVLDEWEIENYGNTRFDRDDYADMDTDGDGYSDLEEYLNGTDISIPDKFIDGHLYLMGNVSYTLEAGSHTQVSGTTGTNNIVLESGAKAQCIEFPGNNTITLASESDLFTISRSGTTVALHGADDTRVTLPATSTPQTIIFSDGAADLMMEQEIVKLGDQVIASYPDSVYTTLEAVPEITENPSASLEDPDAYLILTSNASYTLKQGSNTAIYGSSEGNNICIKSGAAARLYSSQGSNTITIEAESKFFMVSRSGTTVILEGNEGTTLILPATSTPQSIVFSDGERLLIIDSDQVLLGDQVVTTKAASVDVGSEGIGECGAYIAPGVWKEFDCYNLAAIGKTTGDDPFTPSWRLIGGYWQWGRKGSSYEQLTIYLNDALQIKTGNNPVKYFSEITFWLGGTQVIVDITTIADDDTLDYTTAYDEIVDAINAQLTADGFDNVTATRGPSKNVYFSIEVAGFRPGDFAGYFYPIIVTNTGSEELAGGYVTLYSTNMDHQDSDYNYAFALSPRYTTNTSNFADGPTGPEADEANDGEIDGWDSSNAPDGAWSDAYKTANDPCPSGYRVPTKEQWDGMLENNTQYRVGTWSDDYSNYNSAIFFGDDLMLPTAGLRSYNSGSLISRGDYGYYWASTEHSSRSDSAWGLLFYSDVASAGNTGRRKCGFSVRCIAE